MAGVGAGMKAFYGNTVPMVKPITPVADIGTAAITSIDSFEQSTGAKMENLRIIGHYLIKARDSLVMSGVSPTATSMEGVEKAIKALSSHLKVIETKYKVTPIEERMLALEKVVKKSLEEPARKAVPQTVLRSGGRPTYASVVAPPAIEAAIRIRMDGSEKMQPAQLLKTAKTHITGAYAVRQLRSNDTEVFVHSITERDNALKMAQPKEFQILKQDYPVEIMGVPLGTMIEKGKNANNGSIIYNMTEATKARIPGIEISRIRWLYDGKEHQWSKKNGHTRGSVIVSLPTETLQREVVRNGIVLNAVLYTAQLWSPRAQVKQCFNCNQWGHTQASCNKAKRCGECAGTHQTRDCPKKNVSCCNCGKTHRSWQRGSCPSFTIYKVSIERARHELMERTAEIRREKEKIVPAEVTTQVGNKTSSQDFTEGTYAITEGQKRGRGRPRKVQHPATTIEKTSDVRTQASS